MASTPSFTQLLVKYALMVTIALAAAGAASLYLRAADAPVDETGADEAGADDAGADESGADESGADEAGADEAGADDAGADDAGADDAGADDAGADDAGADEAGADDAGADESGADDTGADDAGAGESGAGAADDEGPLLSLHNLFTLLMLTLLQAVLGFDNLLYISIESKKVPAESQAKVRQLGIGVAIGLRVILLFAVMSAIKYFQNPFFSLHLTGYLEGDFNVHSVIVVAGGVFIMYTAMKEIYHMLIIDDIEHEGEGGSGKSVARAVTMIVLMNLVFSFDSILSALALTQVFMVMAVAIVISGLLMMYLADHVSEFLQRNRMYEVLGLFILFIVGVMLLSEGGHLAHLQLFGQKVEPMAKSTFYFVLSVLVLIDIVQSRYQSKLRRIRDARAHA